MRASLAGAILLLTLAGCQGGVTSGPPPTVTVTPAPYVSAPGLSVSGIQDVDRLARAHEQALRGRPYSVRMNLTVRRPNGSLRGGTVIRIRVGADRDRFWLVSRSFGDHPFDGTTQPALAAWSNGSTTFLRRTYPDRVAYRAFDTDDTGWTDVPPDAGTIRTYLGGLERSNVIEIGPSHDRRYLVTAIDGSQSVRATVEPSGLVREFTADRPAPSPYRLDVDGTATFRVRYEAIGTTTVGRPPWLPEAIRVTRNQTYVGQG